MTNQHPPHVSGMISLTAYAPYRLCPYTLKIWGVGPDGNDCHIADTRGWGFLTGADRRLDDETALSIQRRTGQFMVDAMNEKAAAIQPDPQPILDRVPPSPSFSCGDVELTATTDKSGPMDGLEAPTPDLVNPMSAGEWRNKPARYASNGLTPATPSSAPTSVAETDGTGPTRAAQDVLEERHRQIAAEGWSPEHDDQHRDGDMALAAAAYAVASTYPDDALQWVTSPYSIRNIRQISDLWPWESEGFKPAPSRRMLEKAGALILAEIERLDRAALRALSEESK